MKDEDVTDETPIEEPPRATKVVRGKKREQDTRGHLGGIE
jgi:hypothetical protein